MKLVRWYNISLYLPRSGATALHLNCRYTSYTVRLFIKHSSYCANCLRDEIRKRGRNLRKITCTYRRNAEALFLRARECWTVGAKKSGMRKWCFCQIRFDCYFGRSLGLHNDQGSDIYIYIYIYAHAKAIHTCCLRMTEELGSQPKKVYACGSMRDDRLAASLLYVTSQLR